MSELKVEVCKIKEVNVHENADKLSLATVLGWTCVVPKDKYKVGDTIIYIPVDAVLPEALSDRIGVTQYLSKGRVRACRLRGVVSYGLIMDNENNDKVGTDLTTFYGITKFEPPKNTGIQSGQAKKFHPLFTKYTDIDNIQKYSNMFTKDDNVVVTEKLHGSLVSYFITAKTIGYEFHSASHNLERKKPVAPWIYKLAQRFRRYKFARKWMIKDSTYWELFDNNKKKLLKYLLEIVHPRSRIICIRAEIVGEGIQKNYSYGLKGHRDAIFDITVNGRYLDWFEVEGYCRQFNLSTVPVLYKGKFDKEKINEFVNGSDGKVESVYGLLNNVHIQTEGAVIKPIYESVTNKGQRRILKWKSDVFVLNHNNSDFH